MQIEVKVPRFSESVSEATLVAWHKQPGETVEEGESLADIETDKVVLDLPAFKPGVLTQILKHAGDKVLGDEVIALMETSGSAGGMEPVLATPAGQQEAETGIQEAARPETRQAAAESEPQAPARAAAPPQAAGKERGEQRVPMTRIRQRIAERLLQSQRNAAVLTTFNEVNMQPIIDLRNKYREAFEKKHGVRLGFMSFFVKAAVAALQQFPVVNASADGADIIYHSYYDIGVAIGSERGLAVPIIRDADRLPLADIEKQIADFGARAKDGRLTLEELSGGTFSISNGGVFGSLLSTPIINPPQAAILGIHATRDRPVAENGQVVIRPMNYLALSYDHCLIDGREAVQFLAAIKEALEFPGRMLLDL